MKFFWSFGQYLYLLKEAGSRPDNHRVFIKRIVQEMNIIGIQSLGIVTVISLFMGMVLTLEIAYQLVAAWVVDSVIGEIISETTMLELSPTITALVLAGRVGSNIAAEIGNMKISEQIDALDVMGVNAPSYLIAPKIIASVIAIPMLIVISIALSHVGGMFIGHVTGICSISDFSAGAQHTFKTFTLIFAVIKAFTFAFVISSVSSYQGFVVKGGALEVGKASTKAVVHSSILILIFDYLLAQLLL
ncbi:MAG: ABC transporter permease [Bacteroidetes bacterium]|nr:ABC transporter permease [Bacteroidota bacterium]